MADSELFTRILALISHVSPHVVALATIALVYFTFVLARHTKRMADAMSRPDVVVSLEPSAASAQHIDMVLQNTGNATAFDVKVGVEPREIKKFETMAPIPFRQVSVLRPGQQLRSYLAAYADINGTEFDFRIGWARSHGSRRREFNRYTVSVAEWDGYGMLGDRYPLQKISDHLKEISRKFSNITNGFTRIKVDSFSTEDRERERAQFDAQVQELQMRTKRQNSTADSSAGICNTPKDVT